MGYAHTRAFRHGRQHIAEQTQATRVKVHCAVITIRVACFHFFDYLFAAALLLDCGAIHRCRIFLYRQRWIGWQSRNRYGHVTT